MTDSRPIAHASPVTSAGSEHGSTRHGNRRRVVCFVATRRRITANGPLRAGSWLLPCALCLGAVAACNGRADTLPLASGTSDIPLTPDTTLVRGEVPRSTTLASMLSAQGLEGDAVQRIVEAAQTVFDPRRLRSAQPFSLERTLEGALRFFEYEIDPDWFLRVIPVSTGTPEVRAELVPIPKTLEHDHVSGTIGGDTPSLFQAMDAAGE